MAMKKKSVVWGLYRSLKDEKMTAFFANNFNDDRWRKAALKNAFALLGKQRFEHAVAFFLLANSLNDALEVCLTKLNDLQLALIITRLYEGEHDPTPPSYRKLLNEEILGYGTHGQDLTRAHPDPFLRSMALWILKDYSGSLNTLLNNNIGSMHPLFDDENSVLHNEHSTNPNVFNFYVYLRTHPLLIRQHASAVSEKTQVVLSGFSFANDLQSNKTKLFTDKQLLFEDFITPLERQLYFTTAHAHFKAGCPALALEVLSKLPSKVIEKNTSNHHNKTTSEKEHSDQIATGILDWSSAKMKDNTTESITQEFDWGGLASDQISKEEDELKLKWDDDDDDDVDDDEIKISSKIEGQEEQQEQDKSKDPSNFDIMAQQLKFIACLKILMEELSTLATGFEVDGGQLRYQLYIWLEREVEALKQLCNYSSNDSDVTLDDKKIDTNFDYDLNKLGHDKPTLHEILIQEKQDFEAKVQRAFKRKKWLKANETLLRTLLSYCSLHGASGGGLASVRMELILLLQELQQEKTQHELLSPLPFPTTLPLLSASVSANKTVIADPIRFLQSHTHDMLQTVINLKHPPYGIRNPISNEIFVLRDLAIGKLKISFI